MALLPVGMPSTWFMQSVFNALKATQHDSASALRITRALVLERLLCLDCEAAAPLAQITTAMTELAEFALNQAYDEVLALLDATHGAPRRRWGSGPSSGSLAWANSARANSMSQATLT